MTDWDYEERLIIGRYSGYKAQALIWEKRAGYYKELLRRLRELVDPISHEPGECEDCDLMREVAEELGDE